MTGGYCHHPEKSLTVIAATKCPEEGCGQLDFRKLKCTACGYGPYTDTGTCQGHIGHIAKN